MIEQDPALAERVALAKERTELAKERNRLASERTFLAWTRTGLASVAGGLAIMRLLTFKTATHQWLAQAAGSLLVAVGIAIFVLSFIDYKQSFTSFQLRSGYAGALWSIGILCAILVLVSVILLIVSRFDF